MTVTVVGSLAYDAVKTPFGQHDRMLGGAATHFALAASLFDQVRIVGPVGGDFADADFEVLRIRGTLTDDVEVVADGKTFFWRGEYGWDLNSRETLDTQLGVFEHFKPTLSQSARECDVLFLANIVPALQATVLDQVVRPCWTALDSMNLWIDIAREELVAVIERVDCLVLNDAELRQLTGKPSIAGAARDVLAMGPTAVIAKQGEYGAILITDEGSSRYPPTRSRPRSIPLVLGTRSPGAWPGTWPRTPVHSLTTICLPRRWRMARLSRRSTWRSSGPSASCA